jgi:hypothetical protein
LGRPGIAEARDGWRDIGIDATMVRPAGTATGAEQQRQAGTGCVVVAVGCKAVVWLVVLPLQKRFLLGIARFEKWRRSNGRWSEDLESTDADALERPAIGGELTPATGPLRNNADPQS